MSQAISKGTKCCLRWHSLNGHVLLTAVLLWLIERQLNFTEMNQCLQVCSANRSSSALPWRIPRYLKSPNNSTRYMFRGQFGFVENIFFLYKNVRIMLRFLYNWEGGGFHQNIFSYFLHDWRPLYNICAGQRSTLPDRKTSLQICGNFLLKLIKYII